MFEIDENGEEWIGYTFSSGEADPAKVIENFLGNVQYLEWFYRQLTGKSKKLPSLGDQIRFLFELLPPEGQRSITDNREGLVVAIVRTRNRFAHGKFEQSAPSIQRIHNLSVKVAALLFLAEKVHEGDVDGALTMARDGSPYLREQLGKTDVRQ